VKSRFSFFPVRVNFFQINSINFIHNKSIFYCRGFLYFFTYSKPVGFILKRVDHMNIFSIAFFFFAVRFFLYSIIKNPVYVLPVELLNGMTFALAYSAMISYAALLAPPGAEGTLQSIVGTALTGIGTRFGEI